MTAYTEWPDLDDVEWGAIGKKIDNASVDVIMVSLVPPQMTYTPMERVFIADAKACGMDPNRNIWVVASKNNQGIKTVIVGNRVDEDEEVGENEYGYTFVFRDLLAGMNHEALGLASGGDYDFTIRTYHVIVTTPNNPLELHWRWKAEKQPSIKIEKAEHELLENQVKQKKCLADVPSMLGTLRTTISSEYERDDDLLMGIALAKWRLALRKRLKITQKTTFGLLGVSRGSYRTYVNVERCQRLPSESEVLRMTGTDSMEQAWEQVTGYQIGKEPN